MSNDTTAKLGRSTWKGILNWGGFVATPVRAYTMTRSQEPCPLKMVCECGAPVKTAYRCPVCEKDVPEPGRAAEVRARQYVRVPSEALEGAKTARAESLTVESCVATNVVPEGVWRSWYVLLPEPGGEQGYELLRRALWDLHAYAVVNGPIGRSGGTWHLEATQTLIHAHLCWSREVVKDMADFEQERGEAPKVLAADVRRAIQALGKPRQALELGGDAKEAALRPVIDLEVAEGRVYADPRVKVADVRAALDEAARAAQPRRRRKAAV